MAGTRQEPATALTIQQMARASGFSEPTLRYYERIGLLGAIDRDPSSGHRRYGPESAARVEALACLRSSGMTVSGMRSYLELLARRESAAQELRDLFATQAQTLEADLERLRLRLAYLRGKADLWGARVSQDASAEARAISEITRVQEHFTY
ncbi:MerR family transcriptional regulator [Streptomyces sp. NPDC002690]